jgi:hypothetical protein
MSLEPNALSVDHQVPHFLLGFPCPRRGASVTTLAMFIRMRFHSTTS